MPIGGGGSGVKFSLKAPVANWADAYGFAEMPDTYLGASRDLSFNPRIFLHSGGGGEGGQDCTAVLGFRSLDLNCDLNVFGTGPVVPGNIIATGEFRCDGSLTALGYLPAGVAFPAPLGSSNTIANTAAEIDFSFGAEAPVAQPTVLRASSVIEFQAAGRVSSAAAGAGNLTLRAKLGPGAVLALPATALPAALAAAHWAFGGLIVCSAAGAAGNLRASMAQAARIGSVSIDPVSDLVTAIDTTIANTLRLSAQFSVADAANSITQDFLHVRLWR